jgi:hypothetical protein
MRRIYVLSHLQAHPHTSCPLRILPSIHTPNIQQYIIPFALPLSAGQAGDRPALTDESRCGQCTSPCSVQPLPLSELYHRTSITHCHGLQRERCVILYVSSSLYYIVYSGFHRRRIEVDEGRALGVEMIELKWSLTVVTSTVEVLTAKG